MIKVLIAEDMPALLKKYQRLLEKDGELEVVAAVQNVYEAVMKTVLCQPDVILMDIEMETRTAGLDAASQILSRRPAVRGYPPVQDPQPADFHPRGGRRGH